jgi:hypothetical protein
VLDEIAVPGVGVRLNSWNEAQQQIKAAIVLRNDPFKHRSERAAPAGVHRIYRRLAIHVSGQCPRRERGAIAAQPRLASVITAPRAVASEINTRDPATQTVIVDSETDILLTEHATQMRLAADPEDARYAEVPINVIVTTGNQDMIRSTWWRQQSTIHRAG